MRSLRGLGLAIALLCIAAPTAVFADSITYTLTPAGGGPSLLTFSMDLNPTPTFVNLVRFDATTSCGSVAFFTTADLGGFSGCGFDLTGPQLFSGTVDDPTMLAGLFSLTEFQGENSFTLTGRIDSSVPEPGTMLLLGSGLVGAGRFVRRKLG